MALGLTKILPPEAINFFMDPANMALIIERFGDCCHLQINEAMRLLNFGSVNSHWSRVNAQENLDDSRKFIPQLEAEFAAQLAAAFEATISTDAEKLSEINQISDGANDLIKQTTGGI